MASFAVRRYFLVIKYNNQNFLKMPISKTLVLFILISISNSLVLKSGSQNHNHSHGPIQILFLGDQGHHQPARRVAELKAALSSQGIFITYTEDMDDLKPSYLNQYDGLMVYANIGQIGLRQEKSILDFVSSGKAYLPIHCASFCFQNSKPLIDLLGAQFKSHGTGVFRTTIAKPDHPIMDGFQGIESWDETYVHHKHNDEHRIVLSYRQEGDKKEPWTWVRSYGKGKIFYTAWGHDSRTWRNPQFHELIKRGVLWAIDDEARTRWEHLKMPKLKYEEANIPNYEKRDPPPKFQHPLSPEESIKTIQVPVGFEVSLFASEPQIANPTAIAWDEKGRCWVAETLDYPNDMKITGDGKDSIKILEDLNGDGKCDKIKVFADGLSIPTGMVFAGGGLIVSQAPHMLFLKDTDGDDKADIRKVLFSGWGTGDTHAGPSSLHLGFDGWIYGSVGYSGFNGEVGGVRHGFSNGFFRFTPDGQKMEFITKSSNNTWGLGLSETGEWFGSTANNTHSLHLGIPQRFYKDVIGLTRLPARKLDGHYHMTGNTDQIRQVDVHGGFTAAAGHNLYTSREFPKNYWNKIAFVNEPTGHLVHSAKLVTEGSSFLEEDGRNFFASSDAWCAPVFSQVGPDGQVWVSDWYDFIIQHNPLPKGFKMGKGNAYETPLRDNQKARIYRVTYGENKKSYPKLDINDVDNLISTLGHTNFFWRMTAQRLLVQRGEKDVFSKLSDIIKNNIKLDGIGSNPHALHAFWTLYNLGSLDKSNYLDGLNHPAPSVRRAALLAMPRNHEHLDLFLRSDLDIVEHFSDPTVRLATLMMLAEMPSDFRTGKLLVKILEALDGTHDYWMPTAFSLAAVHNASSFLEALIASKEPADENQTLDEIKASRSVNLIVNPGFENIENGEASGWLKRTWSGEPNLSTDDESAASGKNCLKISANELSEAGHYIEVNVKPNMVYRLRAWIKTENLQGTGRGALFYLPEVVKNGTRAIKGTNDWQRIEHQFETGSNERIRIYCMFGGWGKSLGTAWYDDLELISLRPSLGNRIDASISSVVARNYVQSIKDVNILRSWFSRLPSVNMEIVEPLIEGLSRGWPSGIALNLEKDQVERLQKLINRLPLKRQTELMTLGLKAGVTGLVSKAPEPDLGDTSEAQVINLKTVEEKMLFDKSTFKVTAGKRVKIIFDNNDSMPHNIIIGKPGSLEKLGAAADAMLSDRSAVEKGYVPSSPDIIASMGLLFPGQKEVMNFTAPKSPGDYVYVCTFPGHWRIMKGIMKVDPY